MANDWTRRIRELEALKKEIRAEGKQ